MHRRGFGLLVLARQVKVDLAEHLILFDALKQLGYSWLADVILSEV